MKRINLDSLSSRELEVFSQIAEGKNTKEIAQSLFLSVKTIEAYQARIKEKFEIKTLHQLIVAAVRHTCLGAK